MSVTFAADQILRIRDRARRLEERALAHHEELERHVTIAEADVRQASSAIVQHEQTPRRGDRWAILLDDGLRRSQAGLARARHLCVAAHETHLATSRVLRDLYDGTELGEPTTATGGRHAVLVVDDHADSRELMSTVLNEAGFLVRTAANGLEAVIAAYEMHPAVIVMDVTMPVLNGVEATRLIKAIDAIRDARIIAYTARPDFEDKDRGMFAAVLTKPAPHHVVLAAVQQHVMA
jgi:two-component system, cell cycle response regulator DivK